MKRTPRRQKDLRLKLAIVARQFTQRRVALKTRIGETRFSEIVGHRGPRASRLEQLRIVKVLGGCREDYFSAEEIANADIGSDEARPA